MRASLTELRSYRVQGTRNIYFSLPADTIANRPVLSSSEPVTPELEQSLRKDYDR